MSASVFKDAYLVLGGNNVSASVISVSLNQGADTPDGTTMGNNTKISMAGGLKTWGMDVTFLQDHAVSALDSILSGLLNTSCAVELRPTSAAVSATNPKWTGNGIINEYNPLGGTVGDRSTCTIKIVPAGDLTRATA